MIVSKQIYRFLFLQISENSFNLAFQKINKNTLYPTLKQFLRKRILLTQTHLIKISSHCNIINNELADSLAKNANNLYNSLNSDSLIEIQQSLQWQFKIFYKKSKNFQNNKILHFNQPIYFPDITSLPKYNFTNQHLTKFNNEDLETTSLTPCGYYYFECNSLRSNTECKGIG